MQSPRFDPTISLGNVLVALSFLFPLAGSLAYQIKTNTDHDNRIGTLETRMNEVDDRGKVWQPVVQAAVKANDVQDERIGNMADSMRELRNVSQKQTEKLGDIQATLATLTATINLKLK
jgi:methyl-accepting chemotaxis protein